MRRELMHIVPLYLLIMCMFVIQNGKCEVCETKDIASAIPNVWNDTISTENGNVYINAHIGFPNVQNLQVLEVKKKMPINEINDYYNSDSVNLNVAYSDLDGMSFGIIRKEVDDSGNGRIRVIEKCINDFWSGNYEENLYAEDQEDSILTVRNFIERILNNLYGEDCAKIEIQKVILQRDFFVSEKEKRQIIQNPELAKKYTTGKKGIGAYEIYANQTINGIPIIGTARFGFNGTENIKDNSYTVLSSAYNQIISRYEDIEDFDFSSCSIYEKIGCIYDNIKICEFDKIKERIKNAILLGKIKNVYSIELGYVVYADRSQEYNGSGNESFILFPTWLVRCDVEQEGGEETLTDDFDYTKQHGYQKILIDAQTGIIRNMNRQDIEQCYAPKVIE